MRLRWRKGSIDQPHDGGKSIEEAESSLEEAKTALKEAREKTGDGRIIADVLSEIRKQNHFKDIWNEGLRGG